MGPRPQPSPARSAAKLVARTGRAVLLWPGDVVRARRDPLVPPRRLDFVGPGEFAAVGDELLGALVEYGGLRPDDDVLEVGCGNGRLAVPLTRFLSPAGSYVGTDVVRSGIRWCERSVASRHPNFRFEHVDVRHPLYRPRGRVEIGSHRYPFADASFDCVVLTSVFTHLLPDEAQAMLHEVARVLRPGGTLFATWFALDDVARVPPGADYSFERVDDDHAVGRHDVPHARVAFRSGWIREASGRAGLAVHEPIHAGRWRNAGDGPQFHDAVVARRTDGESAP